MPIDPSAAVAGVGSEWSMPPLSAPERAPSSSGFGTALTDAVRALERTQTDAAESARALATGQAADPTSVVMAVERAQLAMQLASQIRTKAVEAAQTILQTEV